MGVVTMASMVVDSDAITRIEIIVGAIPTLSGT